MNDRYIKIATAGNRLSTSWPTSTMLWSEFVGRLKNPIRTEESYSDFMALPKSQQDNLKDVGGFVGGTFKGQRRKGKDVAGRDLITLDMDTIPPGDETEIEKKLNSFNCAYAVYSTRKHSHCKPRLRVILPLDRTVTADEYEPIARKMAELIGMGYADPTTFQAERLMYWPSCSKDSDYFFRTRDAGFIAADGMLGLYQDWKDVTSWPIVPGQSKIDHQRLAQKQGDPTEKSGIVGAFCKTYNVLEAMEKFIPHSYEPTDKDDRYTYIGGTTTGGAVLYEDGKFLYSHHATDPCSGLLVNAFDLVRLHLFGDRDEDAKDRTPTHNLPSFKAMCEFAEKDQAVSLLARTERLQKATEDFSLAPGETMAWLGELKSKTNGEGYEPTIKNVITLLKSSPDLRGRIALDEFANRGVVIGPLPWDKREGKRIWTDTDDAGMRNFCEQILGFSTERKIYDALALVSFENRIDEVKMYLENLVWDGVKRLDTLFIDYLGAEDNEYIRAVTRKSFTAAVARVMVPGCKYDYMPILTGPQGIGKSTLLAKMGKDWFSDSLETFEGKEAAEMLQGVWINEIGELNGMTKSETNSVKLFLSKREDIFRVPYGRRTEAFKRRCVFFGTSNDSEYLKDKTGNRRFWPVDVGVKEPTKNVWEDLDKEVDQLWAEAVLNWQLGEPLFLSGEVEAMAKEEQESHREGNAKEGLIMEYLEKPIPKDFDKLDINTRRAFYGGMAPVDPEGLVERDRVCAAEVWSECLGQDIARIRRTDSMEINAILERIPGWERYKKPMKCGPYGVQKGFKKVVTL